MPQSEAMRAIFVWEEPPCDHNLRRLGPLGGGGGESCDKNPRRLRPFLVPPRIFLTAAGARLRSAALSTPSATCPAPPKRLDKKRLNISLENDCGRGEGGEGERPRTSLENGCGRRGMGKTAVAAWWGTGKTAVAAGSTCPRSAASRKTAAAARTGSAASGCFGFGGTQPSCLTRHWNAFQSSHCRLEKR